MKKEYFPKLIFSISIMLIMSWSTIGNTREVMGSEDQKISVLDILDKNTNQEYVCIIGHLIEKTEDQQYIFTDGTELIIAHIANESFPYPYKITSDNVVEICGQIVWKSSQQPEILVDHFEIKS